MQLGNAHCRISRVNYFVTSLFWDYCTATYKVVMVNLQPESSKISFSLGFKTSFVDRFRWFPSLCSYLWLQIIFGSIWIKEQTSATKWNVLIVITILCICIIIQFHSVIFMCTQPLEISIDMVEIVVQTEVFIRLVRVV